MRAHAPDLTPVSLPQDVVLHDELASRWPLTMYSQTAFPHRPSLPIIQDIFSSPVSCHGRLCVKHLKHGARVTHVSR